MCDKERDVGYRISGESPDCGRDVSGVFHCVCGKCKPLRSDVNHDRDNCSDDCGDSGDDCKRRVDDKTP